MGDWIGLGVIVLVLAGAVLGLASLGRPRERMSADEFERRAAEGRGLMSAGVFAGMQALQKLINPKAAEAVEVQKDLRAGYYDDQQEVGGSDDPGGEHEGGGRTPGAGEFESKADAGVREPPAREERDAET